MTGAPVRVLVMARDPRDEIRAAAAALRPQIENHPGITLVDFVTSDGANRCGWDDAELAIVIGGDGAILRACRAFDRKQIPILGFNLGRLGFLADVSPEEVPASLRSVAARDFQIVHHMMLECSILNGGSDTLCQIGLNEVAIRGGPTAGMLDVQLTINGDSVTTFSGDGLIISTPVGSTAHNLSAGGPILRQNMDAFVVTPICPHSLTIRPMVDPADCTYELSVPDANPGVVALVDGQVLKELSGVDRVLVRRAPVTCQLVRLPDHSYYGTLHRKLGWHGQPRYRR